MLTLRSIWLLNYISIASFSAAISTPALPEIQQFYTLAQGQVEWMVSAFLVGYVLGQLIYGPLANRFGRLKALRLGLLINLVGILICFVGLYNHSYPILILGRLISALGAASGLACTFMMINEWLPEEQRKTAIGSSIVFFTFGIGLAVVLGGLVTEYYDWSYCFIIVLIHGVLMLLGTKVFDETLSAPQPLNIKTIINNYKSVVYSKTLVVYSLVVGLCSTVGYCFSASGPLIANQLFHLSPIAYSYWNGLNMLGMLLGGILAKLLLERYKAEVLVILGLIGTALGLLSLIIMFYSAYESILWFFSSTLVLYLFSGLLFSGGSYLASQSVADKASGSAMMSFINMSSAVLAVICLGYVAANPLLAFISIVGGAWLLVLVLQIIFIQNYRQAMA
jgi:MFS transporter, DHA1 family, multidrug resistance protein